MVEQGDIIYLDFHPQAGYEQDGRRPALVVSNNLFNKINNMTLVCPITNAQRKTPFHVALDSSTKTTGCILCDQVKMLDINARNYQKKEKISDSIMSEVKDILYGIIE